MRLLLIDWELPTFDRTSGGLRLFTMLSLLAANGVHCECLLVARERAIRRFGAAEVDRYSAALAQSGISLLFGSPEEVLRAARYEAVMFEFFTGAEAYGNLVRVLQPQAALVVDSVDINYLRWAAMADVTRLPADRAKAEDVRRRELKTYAHADLVLTLTADETAEVQRQLPAARTFEVPNIHPIPDLARHEAPEPTALFIGSFTHEPNVDAVKWLAREVWPRVADTCPTARLQVVGQLPPPELLPAACVGIDVLGHVPSTQPYLAGAWVSLAPLRFGAGMKGKVGEALAAGLPLVTTEFGAQGYRIVHGESAFLADDAEGFARAVVKLFGDADLRARMGALGRQTVAAHFSREAVARSIPALVATIAAVRPRHNPLLLPLRRAGLWLADAWQRSVAWRINR